jgi:hypothetical protein
MGMWLGAEKVALKALRNIKASDRKAQKVCYAHPGNNISLTELRIIMRALTALRTRDRDMEQASA